MVVIKFGVLLFSVHPSSESGLTSAIICLAIDTSLKFVELCFTTLVHELRCYMLRNMS